MKIFTLFTLLLCLPLSTYAYDGNPTEQVTAFFSEFGSGKVNEAVDHLYSSNPAFQQKIQAIALVKQQIGTVSALYGKYIGNDNVHYEEISPSVVRIVQMANHELHPITWEFYFYRPGKKWMVSQAQFVDQFQVVGRKK